MMEAKMALVSVMRKVKFERSPDTEVRIVLYTHYALYHSDCAGPSKDKARLHAKSSSRQDCCKRLIQTCRE